MRTLLRPTGFVDSPFGHDGKVARLAGGLNWFASVELIHEDGRRELAPVEDIEARFDEAMAADWARIIAPRVSLKLGERTIRLDQPQVMGIINATPDSFSDGGSYADAASAAEAGAVMASQGAALIDVGGESTRPGASEVWEGDEIERVLPVVQQLAAGGNAVSIDTRKSGVMSAAIGAGAGLVNDVSALLWDPQSAEVVAKAAVPVVLMHHRGDPTTMQDAPQYDDVLVEVFEWLEDRIAIAEEAGIARD
ncbi:MAG: dihydropteroate synthase, partial [Sphingomicrobium sp.]